MFFLMGRSYLIMYGYIYIYSYVYANRYKYMKKNIQKGDKERVIFYAEEGLNASK